MERATEFREKLKVIMERQFDSAKKMTDDMLALADEFADLDDDVYSAILHTEAAKTEAKINALAS